MIDTLLARKRIRSILGLLAEERNVILKGPLSTLAELTQKRENLLDSLMEVKAALSEVDLEPIRIEAAKNQRLLDASMSGVKEANRILADQHHVATTMGTYNDSGKRMEIRKSRDLGDRMV